MKHKKNGIFCQSNRLIEARFSLTPNEQKLVIMMISLISWKDKDFQNYEIRVADFSKLLNLKNKNIYSQLKDILCRITSRTVFIKKDNGFLVSSWVSSAEYIERSGIIQLSFDKKLKPYLLELKSEFTKLNLFTVVQFKSSYTIRIYMLLKQYEIFGVREFDLYDFRRNLGIKDNIYKEFKRFRARVINQAKKELDKKDKQGNFISDISFQFEPIKSGRNIKRLRFIIIKNKSKQVMPIITEIEQAMEKPKVPKSSNLLDEFKNTAEFKAIRSLGIAEKKAVSILNNHSTDTIKEKLKLTMESTPNNPSGFFIRALEEDYKSSEKIGEKAGQKNKVLKIPNISDGTQLQAWAIANQQFSIWNLTTNNSGNFNGSSIPQ